MPEKESDTDLSAAEETVVSNAPKSPPEPDKPGNPLALDTTLKTTFAVVAGICGALAAISVFVAPFVKTGPALAAVSLAAFAALMLVGVAVAVFVTYFGRKIAVTVGRFMGALVLAVAVGAGGGDLIWHVRSGSTNSPTASSTPTVAVVQTPSTPAPSPSSVGTASEATQSASGGFTAEVEWTNDGGGGGSTSTNLYAYASPTSELHEADYTLGESLTVVCKVADGRAITVGPSYAGPDGTSTVWYQLDVGYWVPAVYVHVDDLSAVPTCS